MPPKGRQLPLQFHMFAIFKPTLFFLAKDPVLLAIGPAERHISFAPLPLAPAIAEKHIANKPQHRGLTAFIFAHHHIESSPRRLPGGAMIDAVLLQLQIRNFHLPSSSASISAPTISARRNAESNASSEIESNNFLYFTNSGCFSAIWRSIAFFSGSGKSFTAS